MKMTGESREIEQTRISIWKRIRSMKEFSVLVILLALVVFISIMSPAFLTVTNLRTTAIGFSCNAIIAIAMTLALVSGGFDLSVGSVLGLSSVCVVVLSNSGVNIWLACIVGILAGVECLYHYAGYAADGERNCICSDKWRFYWTAGRSRR